MLIRNHFFKFSALLVLAFSVLVMIPKADAEAAEPMLTMEDATANIGQNTSIPIALSEAPNGIAGFMLRVTLSDASVARISGVDMQDYGLAFENPISPTEYFLAVADINQMVSPGPSGITLMSISIEGLAAGASDVQVQVYRMDDDFGDPIVAPQIISSSLQVNSPPTASFSYLCEYLSCAFTDASEDLDGIIASWRWAFGDGAAVNEQNPSHTYASPGTYPVELTVTDNDGAISSYAENVSVIDMPDRIHVHDLDGQSIKLKGGYWNASLTVSVHDGEEGPVEGATVSGSISDGISVIDSFACQTAADGTCSANSNDVHNSTSSVVFTVDSVSHPDMVYDSSQNHDPDGDSDGSSILIAR